MVAQTEEAETRREADAFRPNARPAAIAVAANVVLAALCLGLPYYRGQLQAEQSLRGFAGFAQCLLGGEAQSTLGLGLPPGEEDHFAGQVMTADAQWPERCRAGLREIAPEEAIFLWPSVKQAGADVRAVVELLDRELGVMVDTRRDTSDGRVPVRPLLALSKLRAGLALLARAAGTDEQLDQNAVKFTRPAAAVKPAMLPLTAGSSAELDVWAGPDGLEATAMDSRGISWLRVENGQVDKRRVRRSGLVRAVTRDGDQPYILWATPPDKCAEREDHCVRRATGVARFDKGAEHLPEPTWLAGHPAQAAERSVAFGLEDRLDLLALAEADGSIEIRRFDLTGVLTSAPVGGEAEAESAEGDEEDAPRPVHPVARFSPGAQSIPSSALLVSGTPHAAALAVPDADVTRILLWLYDAESAPREIARIGGSDVFLETCRFGNTRWLVFGSELGLSAVVVGAQSVSAPALLETALAETREGSPRLRTACDNAAVVSAWLAPDGKLTSARCAQEQCQLNEMSVAEATTFSLALTASGPVLAYTAQTDPRVRIARPRPRSATAAASATGPAEVPAACWDPRGGMCGQPTLVADGDRLLLAARDGSDLLVIESEDGGRSWQPMSGLKVSTAISTDASSPMDQHRIRKGLD